MSKTRQLLPLMPSWLSSVAVPAEFLSVEKVYLFISSLKFKFLFINSLCFVPKIKRYTR